MRFGSECGDKRPINPLALAIINQISNKCKYQPKAFSLKPLENIAKDVSKWHLNIHLNVSFQ